MSDLEPEPIEKVIWTAPNGKTRVLRLSWGLQAQYLVDERSRFAEAPIGEWDACCGDGEVVVYEACILDLVAKTGA